MLVAYGAGGSLITIPDQHKLVCSYLGLNWGPCLGGERGCIYAAWVSPPNLPGTAVCRTVVGGVCDSVVGRASGC